MKTRNFFIALSFALLCSGVAILSAMSVGPKPCPWSNAASTPSLDQQGEDMTKELSKYVDFANLSLSSEDFWVLSWRGQVPSKVSQKVEAAFEPRLVVSREVPFNKAQLDSAENAINLKLSGFESDGVTNGSYADLRLDAKSFEVVVNVTDVADTDRVFAEIKKATTVPMTISRTDSYIVPYRFPGGSSDGCQPIAV